MPLFSPQETRNITFALLGDTVVTTKFWEAQFPEKL